MMMALLDLALLALTAIATVSVVFVLADSVIRGRNAYARLRASRDRRAYSGARVIALAAHTSPACPVRGAAYQPDFSPDWRVAA